MKQQQTALFLGIPYDFRPPTWARVKARMWNPGGPMMTPHVWGWGYGLNFAHRGAWVLAAGLALLAFTVV